MLINDFASYFKLQRSEIVGVKSEFLKNYNTDIQGINAKFPKFYKYKLDLVSYCSIDREAVNTTVYIVPTAVYMSIILVAIEYITYDLIFCYVIKFRI